MNPQIEAIFAEYVKGISELSARERKRAPMPGDTPTDAPRHVAPKPFLRLVTIDGVEVQP